MFFLILVHNPINYKMNYLPFLKNVTDFSFKIILDSNFKMVHFLIIINTDSHCALARLFINLIALYMKQCTLAQRHIATLFMPGWHSG